jgi:hypothetical protein
MSGIRRTVFGAAMVFDVVATLGGATIATLGGVAVPTLGAVLPRDGALSTCDMMVESCVIADRCLILALAVVGMVPPSCSKMSPTA